MAPIARREMVSLDEGRPESDQRAYAEHAADMEQLASASLTKEDRKTLNQTVEKDWL